MEFEDITAAQISALFLRKSELHGRIKIHKSELQIQTLYKIDRIVYLANRE